ncbi:MAG: type II toxin-antitoxin system PemK/MazF family toxin [Calditrichia bacterium]
MRRGDLYLVKKPGFSDPKKHRVFVVVSRQSLIDSQFSKAICAPVYSNGHGLTTQVMVGPEDGLKHVSYIHCDELISLPKSRLASYVGSLSEEKVVKLNFALQMALDTF